MHASHSHNYYFIMELLPLAGRQTLALLWGGWHCTGNGGWAGRQWRSWVGGEEALIWVISQPAWVRVTQPPLHPIWKHICCSGYPPELIALIIPDTRHRGVGAWRQDTFVFAKKCGMLVLQRGSVTAHTIRGMEATCQDRLTLNLFKREKMNILCTGEWSEVVGGVRGKSSW